MFKMAIQPTGGCWEGAGSQKRKIEGGSLAPLGTGDANKKIKSRETGGRVSRQEKCWSRLSNLTTEGVKNVFKVIQGGRYVRLKPKTKHRTGRG